MALIQGDAAFFDHARDDAGFGNARANRANAAVPSGDFINHRTHPGGGQETVLAAVHGRAARMGRLAVKCDRVAFNAEGAKNGPQGQTEVQQHRPLFDVQFQVGGRVLEFPPAFPGPLQVNPNFLEGVRQADAVLVLESAGFAEVEMPRTGGGTEEALAEARPFLIGPIDQADGDGRFAVELGVDAPKNLDARQEIKAAVEPAAVGHRVDMAADEQGAIGLAAEGGPGIAGGVLVDFGGELFELLAQPGAGGQPGLGERNALRAVVVPGQLAEFLQLGNRSFRIQRRFHGDNDFSSAPASWPAGTANQLLSRPLAVAQTSKSAVPPISKSARRAKSSSERAWKPATQQTWKSALQNLICASRGRRPFHRSTSNLSTPIVVRRGKRIKPFVPLQAKIAHSRQDFPDRLSIFVAFVSFCSIPFG